MAAWGRAAGALARTGGEAAAVAAAVVAAVAAAVARGGTSRAARGALEALLVMRPVS
jgi:hypothetical protein